MSTRQTVAALLELEHRVIDEGFGQFRTWLAHGQIDRAHFDEVARALRRHIYVEEEIIFAELELRGLSEPVGFIVGDHGEIWRLLNHISILLDENADCGRISGAMEPLQELIWDHDSKEENVLYPLADQVLGQTTLTETIYALLEATPPTGWTCRSERVPS